MSGPLDVPIEYTDAQGVLRRLCLRLDQLGAAADPDVLAQRLREVYGLTEEQAERARVSIIARLHGAALMQLRAQGVPLGAPPPVAAPSGSSSSGSSSAGTNSLSLLGLAAAPPAARPTVAALLAGGARPLLPLAASEVVAITSAQPTVSLFALQQHAVQKEAAANAAAATAAAAAAAASTAMAASAFGAGFGAGRSASSSSFAAQLQQLAAQQMLLQQAQLQQQQQQLLSQPQKPAGMKRGPYKKRRPKDEDADDDSDGGGGRKRRRSGVGGDAGASSLSSAAAGGGGSSSASKKRGRPSKADVAARVAEAAAASAAAAAAASEGDTETDGDDADEDDEEDDDGGGPDDGNVDYCARCEEAGDLLCCDVCPRSYHTACLALGDVPEGEWLCPECVAVFGPHKERLSTTDGPTVTAPWYEGPAFDAPHATADGRERELLAVVRGLAEHEFAVSFTRPVPPSLRDYHKAIARPVDLGTLAARLEGTASWAAGGGPGGSNRDSYKAGDAAGTPVSTRKGHYYGTGDGWDAPRALTDLRLVWSNCKAYNKPGSTIWRMAEVLSRETETALRDRVRLSAAEAARLRVLRAAECSQANLHDSKK